MPNYDDFFFNLPDHEKHMVGQLREIVLACSPDFMEKISYGVPYYFRHSRICFIWPSSVKYGPKEGIYFGLCRGAWLSNEQGIIQMENRKEVGIIPILKPSDINPREITEIVQEAILLDDEWKLKK